MKRLRLKKWVKIVLTIIIIITSILIYHYLGVKGSYTTQNTMSSIFILIGWFWLIAGQLIVLEAIWGD